MTLERLFGNINPKQKPNKRHTMQAELLFRPSGVLRHPHAQSMLASFKPRRWLIFKQCPALKSPQRIILETSEGKLAADINEHPNPKGHAVLLHGWEGCSKSVYLVALSAYLYKRGYSVSRLNLRDHGDTYHLNKDPFHGFLINEVAEATKQLCEHYGKTQPNLLAGFSMGGNFALRVAALAPTLGIPLDATFAVSPAVRPFSTMQALAKGPKLYHHYFRKKWRKSIRAKQAAWAGLYDFEAALKLETLDEMTDFFIQSGLLPANNAKSYLEGYRVSDETINSIKTPTFILSASDDPVIPISDITALPKSPTLNTTIVKHGGHCGFIQNDRRSYINQWIFSNLERIINNKNEEIDP